MDITSYLLGKQAGGGSSTNLQNNKNVTITSNGTEEINPDTGYDGMKKVTVSTNVTPNLETKSVTITENKTTEIIADSGYDGLGTVSVITNVPSSGSSIPIFSTTEVEVGTWIDNKPLYMKTISQDITLNSSGIIDTNIAYNISNPGIMFLGNNSMIGLKSDMTQSYPINYTNTTSNTYSSVIRTQVATNGNIRIIIMSGFFDANAVVTAVVNVFYTKTTDTAVSDVNQVRGLNFSETEHEVGQTADGEIVYEKTVPKSASNGYNNPFNQTFAHNISNAKQIWLSDGSFFYSSSQSANNRFYVPLNYVHSVSDKQRQFARCKVDNTNINIYVGDYIFGNGTLYTFTTLRYIKNIT